MLIIWTSSTTGLASEHACPARHFGFALGDFKLFPQDAKHLIVAYGTYPLLLNWFPEEAQDLWHHYHILRPRSEFFAASARFLRAMLRRKKFAYEQTVAFLIYALADRDENGNKKWRIGRLDLGELSDYPESRRFREAVDQIERTERVLKVLWRYQRGDGFNLNEYENLDRRSTAIRQAAMVYLEKMLKFKQAPS